MLSVFRSLRWSTLLLGLVPFFSSATAGRSGRNPSPTVRSDHDLVDGYRSWRRVTGHLEPMSPAVAFLCSVTRSNNPHAMASFHVYVNPIGEGAMLNQTRPTFPVGTMVVKEKYNVLDERQLLADEKYFHHIVNPNLLTVMRKRKAGFDPKNGDWEYLVKELDSALTWTNDYPGGAWVYSPRQGPAGALKAPPDSARCRSCHAKVRATDYVFRSYLPAVTREKLRLKRITE